MEAPKEIEIPEGYEARIEGNKVIIEPKESEDEMIRKELLKVIKHCYEDGGYALCTDDYKKYLSYLEKQKAKERLDRMAPIYNDKESFESALEKAWKYYNKSGSRTVDSFEDDYIECVFSKGFREGFLYREKQKDQKPVITGDDVAWIDDLKHDLEHPEELDEKVQEALKKRQKPAEWSEEDERMLEPIISDLRELCNCETDEELISDYEDRIAWLKSLRPQPHWKPSEYTLSLVKKVADGEMLAGVEQMAMGTLYEQLKKL